MANIVGVITEEKGKDVVTPQEEKPVFKVNFSCKNCSTTFENQFKRGIDLNSNGTESWYSNPTGGPNYIRCNNCDSRQVSVNYRRPL